MRAAMVAGTGDQGLAAEPTNDEPITVNPLGGGNTELKREVGFVAQGMTTIGTLFL
jgi:hypothetical protein